MTGSPDAAPTPTKALGADAPPKNFEVGAKVRVVVEGEVNPNTGGDYLYVDSGNGRSHGFYLPNLNTPVEVLTPPAPTWEAGDVGYDTTCNQTWFRSLRGTWIGRDGQEHDDGEFIERCEWTLLVRDGKVVAP